MITSMAPLTGRVAVVVPQGALFRRGKEAVIRQHVLEADLVEAVIGLAPNLFYGTQLAASVMILRAKKPQEHEKKVLFINAESLYRSGRNQNSLEPEHAARILSLYQEFGDERGLSTVATLDEIAKNDFNLNISLYVEPAPAENELTLEQSLELLRAAHENAKKSRRALEGQLANWGLS